MDFRFEQRYDASPREVAAAYADPALYGGFGDLPKLSEPEVLDHEADGTTVHLRIRYRFAGDLPAAARRVLDPSRLTWVEHSAHDLDTLSATFRMVPDHYRDRFRAGGTYRFDTSGSGTLRRSAGDVRVSTPLVGRAVERAIVSGLGEHLHAEIAVVEHFLRAR